MASNSTPDLPQGSPPGGFRRRLRSTLLAPSVAFPLIFLGLGFVLFYPVGRNWALYVVALLIAVVYGVRVRRRRDMKVLEYLETDTERVWIVRQRMRKGRGRLSPEPPSGDPVAGTVEHATPTAQARQSEPTIRRSPFPRPGESLADERKASTQEMTDSF